MVLDAPMRAAMLAYEAHRIGAEKDGVTLPPWTSLALEDQIQHRDAAIASRVDPSLCQPEYNAIIDTVLRPSRGALHVR